MPNAPYISELVRAIRAMHGVKAVYLETVPVREGFRGQVAWEGEVIVFAISGHPKAKQCFAWGVRQEDGTGWEVTAVLAIPPVTSAGMAVKSAIVAYARQHNQSDERP